MPKAEKIIKPDFYIIPCQLADDERIEPLDEKVYSLVYWFEHLKDGECWASNKLLADILKRESRSVQNSLTKLENCGYIQREYKDEAKRNRMRIRTLIAFKFVRSVGDTQKSERSVGDTQKSERSVGDRANEVLVTRDSNIRKNINNSTASSADPIIPEIIKLFESINPNCKNYYGNKTQRKAIADLLELYGFEKLRIVVEKTLPKTNTIAYMPTITTPVQLRDKWAALGSAVVKANGKINSKGRGLA